MVSESFGWQGRVTVTRYRHPVPCEACRPWCGRPGHQPTRLSVVSASNLITTVGRNWLRDAFEDAAFDAGTRFMGYGTGSAAPAAGNTTLATEAGRKAVSSWSEPGTGQKITTVFLGPEDANITIEELGWFVSSTATATANSGILLARVLYPGGAHTKDSSESLQIDRTDDLSGV